MIYDQKPILPEKEMPDCDANINYYNKYQSNVKTETPSLFIFLVDQSGSMSGNPIKLVSESLLFFLQSLPKDSYFQINFFFI
jgi:Mg-chelatase subunit ChlD